MSRIFHPCIFDRPVFSCLAFSVAPTITRACGADSFAPCPYAVRRDGLVAAGVRSIRLDRPTSDIKDASRTSHKTHACFVAGLARLDSSRCHPLLCQRLRVASRHSHSGCCYSAPDRAAEYCDERVRQFVSVCVCVCVFVCLSVHDHIFGTTRPIITNFLRVRGSVLL